MPEVLWGNVGMALQSCLPQRQRTTFGKWAAKAATMPGNHQHICKQAGPEIPLWIIVFMQSCIGNVSHEDAKMMKLLGMQPLLLRDGADNAA